MTDTFQKIEWTWKYPSGKGFHVEETMSTEIPKDAIYSTFRDQCTWSLGISTDPDPVQNIETGHVIKKVEVSQETGTATTLYPSIPDGGYYLFDSDGWSYVIFRANRIRTMTEGANLATHQAARDHFSDLDPDLNSPTDDTGRESDRVVLDPDLAAAIVMEVHGHDDPSEIWVVRES